MKHIDGRWQETARKQTVMNRLLGFAVGHHYPIPSNFAAKPVSVTPKRSEGSSGSAKTLGA